MDCTFIDKLTVNFVTPSDIEAVLKISDDEMGPGYMDAEDVQGYIDDPKTQIITIKNGNHAIGVGIAFTTGKRDLENEKSLNLLTNHFADVDKIGAVKTIMVDRNYQHKGVGTLLVKHCLDFLKADGAQACYAVALKMLGTVNIAKVLDRFGFTPLKEIKDFWAFKSIEWDFICPACGEPPCRCDAIIYTLYPVGDIIDPIDNFCSKG